MVKAIGFIIILMSCSKIGVDVSNKYRYRTKELRSLITAFELMKNEISFKNSVVGDVLNASSAVFAPTVKHMLKSLADAVKDENITAEQAFEKYLLKNSGYLSLKNEDTDVLKKFFSTFGSYSVQDELDGIDAAAKALETNLKNAVSDEKRYVRLSAASGILSGFLIGMLFI